MLQQTVIKAALPAYERFLKNFPTVYALAAAEEAQVKRICQGLGYYRRFGFLHRAAKTLVESAPTPPMLWPRNSKEWQKLPGIGPYTAAALASITLDEPIAVVDGNVERVICRLNDVRKPVNLPELKPFYYDQAMRLLAPERPGDFNQAMMELGQIICKPTNPLCVDCPIQVHCKAYALGSQKTAPGPKIRRSKVSMNLSLFIIEQAGKFGLFARADTERFLKGTLGFLTSEGAAEETEGGYASNKLIGTFRHTITHHELTVYVYQRPYEATTKLPHIWIDKRELDSYLVASLDRKAWRIIQSTSELKK